MYTKKICFPILLVMIVILLAGCSITSLNDPPKANHGVLDLSNWPIKEKVVSLDGEWEFYWRQLLSPGEFTPSNPKKSSYINLPQSWNHYYIGDKKLSGDGYATYRLMIKTDESGRYGIKIPRIFTSYKLWVNRELIASAGKVGISRKSMTPQYLPQVALFNVHKGENQIVIQVSNFYHRSGGILESLSLGSENKILELYYKNIVLEFILFGSLMITGIYHLGLFSYRKTEKPSLYFGLFCLLVGTRTLLVGEGFFIYLFPNFNWEIAHKVQTLAYYLGVPIILMFFKAMFSHHFSKKIVRTVQGIGILFTGLVLLTPAKLFTIFNPFYQIFSVVTIIYITVIFLKMIVKKEKGVILIFIGALALIITSLNDIVYLSIWKNDHSSSFLRALFRKDNLSSIGQLIFVFVNSLVLVKRYAHALEQEEEMSARLKEINFDLDMLVMERTKALEKSREEIEYKKIELEKANEALQLISLKDPLTGLWNRRKYDEAIRVEWNRCLRYKRHLSFLILDIDNFKAYNDRYGHNAGDECLVKIARAVKESFKRESDLATRYGGEEFVVVMPELGTEEAMKMAASLRETIENLHIPHDSSLVSQWVTVSIGVTSMIPDANHSAKDLLLTADKALYQAKSAGKNRVEFLR